MGIVTLAALAPLFMGFIYYHPKVFGTAWMKVTGIKDEDREQVNMAKIFITTYILSFIACFFLFTLVVHQTDIYSLFANREGFGEEGSEVMNTINNLMDQVGGWHRSFGHGMLHGSLVGFFIGLPILMINGLFEMKSMKYGFINAGYWILTLGVSGGILCQFA